MASRSTNRLCGLRILAAYAVLVAGCALSHRPLSDGGHIPEGGDVTADRPADRADACSHTVCGTACVDTSSDHNNCGACGHACAATEVCSGGRCGTTCVAPQMACSGSCVDVTTDGANCGSCGHACGAGMSCTAGVCGCNAGLTLCGSTCVDFAIDPMHCGACGTVCPASQMCGGGTCHVACTGPNTACAGLCVNLTNDVQNCGACGTVCAFDHASPSCSGSACRFTCLAGYGDCDGDPSNGCETDLGNTTDHCGTCANACTTANGSASCVGGHCAIASCDAGYGDCDGNSANGCEVALNSLANCGACRNACSLPHATATCATGTCSIATCAANFDDCDGVATNGCETDLRTTAAHCGSCANNCPSGETCASSACQCVAPRVVCGGSCVDLTTNSNCGTCGMSCFIANSSCMLVTGGVHQCRCNTGYNWCMNTSECRTTCP